MSKLIFVIYTIIAVRSKIMSKLIFGIYTQLANMSFDKIFDLTAGVHCNYFKITMRSNILSKLIFASCV